jgi:L,D-transpeptidase-like protein
MTKRVLTGSAAVLGIAAAVVVIAGCGLGAGTGGDPAAGKSARPTPRAAIAPGTAAALRAESRNPRRPVPTVRNQPRRGRYFAILQVRDGARVALFANPGGRFISTVSDRSGFGSPRVFAVARQRGSWLGVLSPLRPDGELGWLRFDEAKLKLYWTRYSLRVLLSKRTLELRYGGRVLGRYMVTVGAAGSVTPRGRFGITDALAFGHSPFYGCCALALSGHQEHLPVGWLGGDRIAIHGTPGPVGFAASHGCIRATDATMHALFRRVPLGTPVFVTS